MSNWRNRKLSPADAALVADVEQRLADPTPPSPAQPPTGRVDLEAAKATLRRLRAALIATSDRLDVPYTDAPEWTPWSRYINPAMSALDETFDALLADLDAARQERGAVAPVIRRQVAEEIAWAIEHPIGPQEVRWAPIARRWMAEAAAIARSHSTQPPEEVRTDA